MEEAEKSGLSRSDGCLSSALGMLDHGVPITLCRVKAPYHQSWGAKRWTADEVRREFRAEPNLNVGVVLGPGSGIVDFEGDDPNSERDLLELFDGVVPSGASYESRRGKHRFFRYHPKLALLNKSVAHYKSVEIRGCNDSLAQSLVPPSTTDEHTRQWTQEFGLEALPEIPAAVIEKLLAQGKPSEVIRGPADGSRPGDAFNQDGPDWHSILTPHGWVQVGVGLNNVRHWRRPGKMEGISATTGFASESSGVDFFYVFTSNGKPFEEGKGYTKFAAFALLEHQGNFSAAAAVLAKQGFGKSKEKPNSSAALVALITEDESSELWTNDEGVPFASLEVDGVRRHFAIRGSSFKGYLSRTIYRQTGQTASKGVLGDAIDALAGIAEHDGETHSTAIRVATVDDSVYIDRGSDAYDAILIANAKYEIVQNPPVRFRRSASMKALPLPVEGGSIHELRQFLNLSSDQFYLYVAVLIAYVTGHTPYPVLVTTGEQGTAKSTLSRVTVRLIDPKVAELRSDPRDSKTLMVAAQNNYVLAFDNLSKLPDWLSDGFCRMSTGGGFGSRELYTNHEELVIDAQRPVLLTSITDIAQRADLMNRSVILELERIDKSNRKTEKEFNTEFDEALPRILGALYQIAAEALATVPYVQLSESPRMADFAKLGTAAEPSLGLPPGTFMELYAKNQGVADRLILESTVCRGITAFIDEVLAWTGTVTELDVELKKRMPNVPPADWPTRPQDLGGELVRSAPVLRKAGYRVERDRTSESRMITLTKA